MAAAGLAKKAGNRLCRNIAGGSANNEAYRAIIGEKQWRRQNNEGLAKP